MTSSFQSRRIDSKASTAESTNDRSSAGPSTRSYQQRSYTSQAPLIPVALGIGDSKTTSSVFPPDVPVQTPAAAFGWTLSSSSSSSGTTRADNLKIGRSIAGDNEQSSRSGWGRSPMTPPSSRPQDKIDSAGRSDMRSNLTNGTYGEPHMQYSSFNDGIDRDKTAASSNATLDSPLAVNSNGNSNGNSTRNFLVPIGSTGARQKLSILSASQRPATSQSTMTEPMQAPKEAIIQQYRGQIDAAARRRPATGGEDSRMTSVKPNTHDSTTKNAPHSRSMSLAEDRQTGIPVAPSSSWSTDRLDNDRPSGTRMRSFGAHATPTPDKQMPAPYRSMSQQDLRESIAALPANQGESSTQSRANKTTRMGMNWRQPSRDGSVKATDGDGDSSTIYQQQGDRSITYTRSSDNLRSMRSSRPASSSSNKDRAVKIGAGIKNIFGSKSIKEVPSNSADDTSYSIYDENHADDASSSLGSPSTIKQQQQQKRASPTSQSYSPFLTRIEQSPRSKAIDVTQAKNAGWTALPLGAQDNARPVVPFKSKSRADERSDVHGADTSSSIFTKSTELAPLIDFQLPITTGLFDDFTSESLFSYSDISGDKEIDVKSVSNGIPVSVNGIASPIAGKVKEDQTKRDQGIVEKQPARESANTSQRTLVSMPSSQGNGDRSLSSRTTAMPETPRGSSTSTEKTLPRNSPSYDRLASLSSLSDSLRRESNATSTSSDAHGPQMDSMPLSASALSASSSAESTYSAPNSSRSWTPNNPERTSLPMTSPLLVSVLGQHVSSSQPPIVDTDTPPRRVRSPLAAPELPSSNAPLVLPSEWERVPDVASTSNLGESNASSPRGRPDLPTKSRERQTSARSGAPTANTTGQQNVTPLVSSDDSSETAKKPLEDKILPANLSKQSLYVPPGALTFTRKGTAVKPTITKTSVPPSSAVDKDQAVDSNSWSFEGGLLSPRFQSHFSMASSDPHSSPHDSLRLANGAADKVLEGKAADGQIISFTSEDYDSYDHEEEDSGSVDAVNLLPISAWNEVESALVRFKSMSITSTTSTADKGGLLRSVLLPFLALEAETVDVQVSGPGQFQSGKSRRSLFFNWIQQLLLELQTVQTSADRGAILESIACIIESRNFTATMFQSDLDDSKRFYTVFGQILSYAIGELNKKGVYQNTLIFSGRLLAVAFFRIEGVASKLLRALPVNRFALERVAAEIKWENNIPYDWEAFKKLFPTSLHDFCFQDARTYLKLLDAQTTSLAKDDSDDEDRYLVRQDNVEVEMSGNWLRRWQSDDSELFFSFCRSYHRQMATLLTTSRAAISLRHHFFGGPGYAHLATCIHQKCLSLVHRDILSVTTLSSQKNFNPGETANVLSGSTAGKPRHLEAANRRCTAIVVDIIRAPSATQHHTFGPMLGIHIKCLIKRTSLYDVQGVFCLLDWLDGVLNHLETAELPIEKLVDMEFVIESIWLLLKDADHALALMRTIAFCYSNFAILTSTSKNRIRFCQEILLHPKIFQKLFLSWSFTIRAYFLHLLVFRLARINDFAQPEDDVKGKTSISIAKLFNQRLDEIRKRHDELSPPASSADSASEEEGDLKRFKNRPHSFVSTIKHTGNLTSKTGSPASMKKAEKLLGIGQPDPALANKGESKGQSRAAKWLRALGSKGANKNGVANKRFDSALLPGVNMWGGSPTIENKNAFDNGHTKSRKRLASVADESEMDMEKGDDRDEGSDPTALIEDGIDDTTPTREDGAAYEFNFEGRPGHEEQHSQNDQAHIPPPDYEDEEKAANEHISRKLSFDLQSPISIPPPLSQSQDGEASSEEDNGIKLPIPNNSHRVSRAFNRRQSLLPGPAYDLVHHDSTSEEDDFNQYSQDSIALEALQSSNDSSHVANLLSSPSSKRKGKDAMQEAEPYRDTLHIYAIQSLREYEQTVLEHDEFFGKQGDEENPQVPRLPIQWPAMWSE